MTNSRWTEERGRAVIGEWRRSGQSMSAFARERGWNVQRLAYWRDRLEGDETGGMRGPEKQPPRWLPAVVVGTKESVVARVVFEGGVTVEVEAIEALSPDWIARVAESLGRQS